MLFRTLTETSEAVAATRSWLGKIDLLRACLRQFAAGEIETGVGHLIGVLRQGRIGLGPSIVRHALGVDPANTSILSVGNVDAAFESLATVSGKGSNLERKRLLSDLFGRATAAKQEFLPRLVLGELRQGAPEGVMVDAKSPSTTANEFAISRRHGAALRARHTVPGRQGARGCRHDRYGSRNIHAAIALNANAIPAATRQDTCRDAHNRAQVSIRTRTNHRQGDFR